MALRAPVLLAGGEFAGDVRAGLSKAGQRELPSKYLYDDAGTALFEAITLLPEYGLARADMRLLRRYAAEIATGLPERVYVAELGSGTGRKTRWLLEALARCEPVHYFPIDLSATALEKCCAELSGVVQAEIEPLELPYLDGLREASGRRAPGERLLVLFLGSSIGNFDLPEAERFLAGVRECLETGDALLLGTDLEQRASRLVLAYDDPVGVTAAFNRNLLARINRELGGDFVLAQFAHEARYVPQHHRIEMHLRALARQDVRIEAAGFRFSLEKGETIRTELCHKYRLNQLAEMARRAGFAVRRQWVDTDWPFAESLWVAT